MSAADAVRAPVCWSIDPSGVASVEMRDADGRNALSASFVDALTDALAAAASDPTAKVIVLLGTPEVFCSGAPKSLLRELAAGTFAPAEILLPKVVLGTPLPLIAAMEGHAVGGGFALGLCADVVLIARESRYGCNFIDLGITPGMGTTRLLEHVMSPAAAREMLFTGELRRGADFGAHVAFNAVLMRAAVRSRAFELAGRMAEKPRAALETLKRGLAERRRRIFEETLALESAMHREVLRDPHTRSLIEAAYVD